MQCCFLKMALIRQALEETNQGKKKAEKAERTLRMTKRDRTT